jgi:hypothetical protein
VVRQEGRRRDLARSEAEGERAAQTVKGVRGSTDVTCSVSDKLCASAAVPLNSI